jgi:hypothetical protein
MSSTFKIGDSVVVKPGINDPDLGGDIGGWQGRITDIYPTDDGKTSITIAWDSITLRNMPESTIIHCEREGLDWAEMGLPVDEIVLAKARDTEQNAANTKADFAERFFWFGIGDDEEQGRRIQTIVNSAPPGQHHEMAVLEAWDRHLRANLTLPFEAEVYEFQERGSLRVGDRVTVISMLDDVDDLYGVLVSVQHRRKKYHLPLCDLDVSDQGSPNYQLVADYRVWFANR